MKDEQEKLTDEELFLLCEEEEKKQKILLNDARDKGIDWMDEILIWEKYNPRNFK